MDANDKIQALNSIAPLEDRVMAWASTVPFFTYDDLRPMFPDAHERTLYRIVAQLVKQNRLRFVSYMKKKKVYTAVEESSVPYVPSFSTGKSLPSSLYLKYIDDNYKETKKPIWTQAEIINQLPVIIANLFVIPHMATEVEQKMAYFDAMSQLGKVRTVLTTMLDLVDNLRNHPTMRGDVNYFMTIFTSDDKELPTDQEVIDFRRWATKYWNVEEGPKI